MKKIGLLLCLILLIACNRKSEDTLTIGALKGPSAVSLAYWLKQSPVIKGKKLQVEIFDEVPDLQAKMIQGSLDFAVLPTTVAAILYNKGVDYRIVACPVQGSIYVVTSAKINSFTDLKNREIMVSGQGTTPDVLFTLLATKYSFKNKELFLDYKIGTHHDLAQALVMGKVETALLPEPFATLATSKNKKLSAIINLSDELRRKDTTSLFALSAFVASRKLVEKNPRMVDSVSAHYQRAIDWLYANPQEAAQEVVKAGILPDKATAEKSIPRCNIHYLKVSANVLSIKNYLRIFYQFDPKIVGGRLPDKRFYYGVK